MKTLVLNQNSTTNCEGVSRRDVLRVGALSFFGLTLPDILAIQSAAAAEKLADKAKADAVILMWCSGGPTHLDTFDPKPDAPSEVRGPFNAIPTNVDGIQLSEHLPNTAKVTDKIAIVRSLASNIAAHEQASQYLLTGYKPLPTLEYPAYGAVVSKELGPRNNLPAYITIPDAGRGMASGFIGGGFNPFSTSDPATPTFRVADVNLPRQVGDDRLTRRKGYTDRMNERFATAVQDPGVRAVDSFYQRAYDLVGSQAAKKAFDLSSEDPKVRETYGQTTYGQGALLARRLVEAGARFVTVQKGGWDTHDNAFQRLSGQLLPELDKAYAALLTDLAQRGTLDRTLVVLMGEFGRTPRINPRGGRDHWARCRFVTFAGAGIRGGQVIGKSDEQGGTPSDRPVSVEDVATTLYSALGIDYMKQYITPTGRPIHLAQGGGVIKELWS